MELNERERDRNTEEEAIELIDTTATNRDRLPEDLHEYFRTGNRSKVEFLDTMRCKACGHDAPHYWWIDNSFPTTHWQFCTRCQTITSQID